MNKMLLSPTSLSPVEHQGTFKCLLNPAKRPPHEELGWTRRQEVPSPCTQGWSLRGPGTGSPELGRARWREGGLQLSLQVGQQMGTPTPGCPYTPRGGPFLFPAARGPVS